MAGTAAELAGSRGPIPFMASRIVKGDVGGTVLVLLRSATWTGKMAGKL